MPKHAEQQRLQFNTQKPPANLNANSEPKTYIQSQIPSKDAPTIPKAGTAPRVIMNPTSINATSTNTTTPATLDQSRQPPNISLVSSTCFILIGGALVCMAVLSFYSTGTLGTWYKGLKNIFGKKSTWMQRPCTPQKEKVSPCPGTHKYSDGICKRNHAHGDGGFKVAGTGVGGCAWGYDGAGDEMGEYGGRIGLLERWKGGSGSPGKKGGRDEEEVEMGDWDGESQLRELETARIVCDRLSFSVV